MTMKQALAITKDQPTFRPARPACSYRMTGSKAGWYCGRPAMTQMGGVSYCKAHGAMMAKAATPVGDQVWGRR